LRVYKSQCSLFKDLYRAYLQGEVEEETRSWMAKHKEECSYCREWAMSTEENREDKVIEMNVQEGTFDEAKGAIKKAKMVMSIAIGMVVFIALWMSLWLSA
jgi:predicted anti-sigma-YlaC factor YlaD